MASINYKYSPSPDRSAITSNHFGTNILTHRDDVSQDGRFDKVTNLIESTIIRYPGGTVTEDYFDLTNPDQETALNLTVSQSPVNLIPLSSFLEYANAAGKAVIIVVPTFRYFDGATRTVLDNAEGDIRTFVRELISGKYGDAEINGFEIGNEWYQDRFNWTAAEFGQLQSKIASWIHDEMEGYPHQANIYVQAGRGDDDENGIADNLELAAAFPESDRTAIDGIISHVYLSTSSVNSLILGGSLQKRLETAGDIWNDLFKRDLNHIVTEWNVGENGAANTTINGLMRSAPYLRLFTEMLEADIDTATAWTAVARSPAAMGNIDGESVKLTPTGLLFRLMSQNLIGLHYESNDADMFIEDAAGEELGYSFAFSSDDKSVFVFSSASSGEIPLTADLSKALSSAGYVYAYKLSASEGFSGNEFATEAKIGFLNRADIEGEITGDGKFSIELGPYETVMLVVSQQLSNLIKLDPQAPVDDFVQGSSFSDTIFTYNGDDTIYGFGGDDLIHSGKGRDEVYGGDGDDTIYVNNSFSRIDGGNGVDEMDFSVFGQGVSVWTTEGIAESQGKIVGEFDSVERFVGSDYDDLFDLTMQGLEAFGGDGNDTFYIGDAGGMQVQGGAGDDFLMSWGEDNIVFLGDGDDRSFNYGDRSKFFDGGGQDVYVNSGNFNYFADGEGDDVYIFGNGYGNTFDLSNSLGFNTIHGFIFGIDRIILTDEQIDIATFEMRRINGQDALHIEHGNFSAVFVGVSHIPGVELGFNQDFRHEYLF